MGFDVQRMPGRRERPAHHAHTGDAPANCTEDRRRTRANRVERSRSVIFSRRWAAVGKCDALSVGACCRRMGKPLVMVCKPGRRRLRICFVGFVKALSPALFLPGSRGFSQKNVSPLKSAICVKARANAGCSCVGAVSARISVGFSVDLSVGLRRNELHHVRASFVEACFAVGQIQPRLAAASR